MRMRSLVFGAALVLGLGSGVEAPPEATVCSGVYNLHLVTDNVPDFTDLESFIHSATDQWETPQDKCIAVWRWARRCRRQTSCAREEGRYVWDPILHYNSYGAMNCGIVSALNVSCWLQLGYRARYIELGGHTVSEVSWDEGKTWHLFDSSMSIFCYNHRGEVAGCEEIKEAHGCELSGGKVEPGHYYLYHYAPQCATHPGPTGWRCASDNPVDYKRTLGKGAEAYVDGFSVSKYCQHARYGRRYVLNIRPYESYTRYWEPLDDARRGGDTSTNDPDYFRPLADGSDPDDQHGLNNIRGNGLWLFAPDLSAEDCRALFYDEANIETRARSGLAPNLHPAEPGRAAQVTFKVSAANVITSMRIEASGLRRTRDDRLRILVSRYAGLDWRPVWEAADTGPQAIDLKLRDEVAGVTECLIRVEMSAERSKTDVGLDTFKVTTITQLNRRALPRLTLGTNHVLLRADEQAETTVLWPPLHAGLYKRTVYQEHALYCDQQPDGFYKATLGAAENNEPCFAVWRLPLPTDITDVTFGAVVTTRSSTSEVSLQYSWDGEHFTEFYRRATGGFPFDKQVLYTVPPEEVPEGAREVYLKTLFTCRSGAGTYNAPGIQDLLIRVHHRPRRAGFQPIEVTYNWTEHRPDGDLTRSHTELVTELPHRWVINVAGVRDPTMNWVRINLKGYSPEPVTYGYSDGVDVGPGYEYPKVTYTWGRNLALGRPYSASRPSSPASRNPDADGTELTNGIIIPPTDYITSGRYAPTVRAATAFWDPGEPVTFVVDLGSARSVAGVRVSTHQPNARYCHPESVEVAVSTDGETWRPVGTIHHDDLWKPPADYEPWEHDDDPSYAALPAGGRLAYSYPLVFAESVQARYVRFVFTPLEGRGLGISELEVFDEVTVEAWPGDVVLPEP